MSDELCTQCTDIGGHLLGLNPENVIVLQICVPKHLRWGYRVCNINLTNPGMRNIDHKPASEKTEIIVSHCHPFDQRWPNEGGTLISSKVIKP